MHAPATSFGENSASSAAAWLNHATAVLNPASTPNHTITVSALEAFLSAAPPTPPDLNHRWRRQVFARPGEPHVFRMLRCLALPKSRTHLAPHFALGEEEEAAQRSWEAPAAARRDSSHAARTLFCERCIVVGWRVEPTVRCVVETGWQAGSCAYCEAQDARADAAAPQRVIAYSNDCSACDRCGRTLPRELMVEEVAYVVVQRIDHTRVAAAAYGHGALQHLALGASVRALLYIPDAAQQPPQLVLHVAEPCPPIAPLLLRTPQYQVAADAGARQEDFRTFYADLEASALVQRWDGAAFSLAEVAEGIAPQLLGQTRAKTMALLGVLHALYIARTVPNAQPRCPLHLLLVGPGRSGKSALLQGVVSLMGLHAEGLESTIVRGARSDEVAGAHGGALIRTLLPCRQHALLMAGLGTTATTLVLDELPAAPPTVMAATLDVLEAVLEGDMDDAWENDSAVPTTNLTSQLVAVADEESAVAGQLGPSFSLVAAMAPANAQGDVAVISQDVVAASRARATSSRPASRSASGSRRSAPSSTPPPPPPGSPLRRRALQTEARASRVGSLTTVDLQYLLQRAADPALLNATVRLDVCLAAYMPKLAAAAHLLDETRLPTGGLTPQPYHTTSLPTRSMEMHLVVLRSLSRARLLLVPAEEVRSTGLTAAIRDEVWALYEHHLVTVGALMQRRRDRGGRAEARVDLTASTRVGGTPVAALVGRSTSKKQRCLLFLEELRRCQAHAATAAAGGWCGVASAQVASIFAEMGGCAAFGCPLGEVMEKLRMECVVLAQAGGWRIL